MKFSAQEEIDAPAAEVFARISDADRFEERVRERGGKIARSPAEGFGIGTTWDALVAIRGKSRKLTMKMVDMTPGERMSFEGGTSGMDLNVILDTTALTPKRTRMRLQVEAKPKTLAARLLIQSAKLAKGRIDRRFKDRFSDFAKAMAFGR